MSKPSSSHTEREGGEGVSLESLKTFRLKRFCLGIQVVSSKGVTGCIGNMYCTLPETKSSHLTTPELEDEFPVLGIPLPYFQVRTV